MMMLIAAAVAAAQPAPAPAPSPHGAMSGMSHEQHEGMKKEECCCDKMGKGEHDMPATGAPAHRGD